MVRPGSVSRRLIADLRSGLKQLANADDAPIMQAYMKSTMPYYGVKTPARRKLQREVFRRYSLDDFAAFEKTILALWRGAKFREERYAATELCFQKQYHHFLTLEVLPLLQEMIVAGAWWDLVDEIAVRPLWVVLSRHPRSMKKTLRQWAKGDDMWLRRSAIIAQIKAKDQTDPKLLYACIKPSLNSTEFFLRKAIGWALREYAKTAPEEVLRYTDEFANKLSALSYREARRNIAQ